MKATGPEVAIDTRAAAAVSASGARGELRWYAVHALPGSELRARMQLERQGFRVFLPQRLKTVRHARKLTTRHAPFFPRYLFVELDLSHHRWRSVNGTFGVASLIMQGDRPHPVPHGIVEALLACADHRGYLRLGENLQVGAQVRLAAGPFADQLGVLERLDASGRVRVLLDIMGAAVPVDIRREFVAAA
jgi:transcriptional antiterminator RfaH